MLKKLFSNFRNQNHSTIELNHGTRDIISNNCINIQVHQAVGGLVLQIESYDMPNDRINRSLYVITQDQNLGEEVSRILTLEALKI